jgi:hypothetical protein
MKTIINDKRHEIIYIDYNGSFPHQVYTIDENGHSYSWDFFLNNGNKKDLRYYNSGSGYRQEDKIQAPNWIKGCEQKLWLGIGTKLKGKTNGLILSKPLRVKGYSSSSVDPFKVSEETHNREYCEECGCESTEFCHEHKYDDDNGYVRWKHNNEFCN